MQQFQSLQRLMFFYAMTLVVMLALYYFTLFNGMKKHNEQHSIETFYSLKHEFTEHAAPINREIKTILAQPALDGVSYQLIFMMPSGQTYIHRYTRPNEHPFTTITFPTVRSSSNNDSAYTLNTRNLTGTIRLESGHHIYLILRHKPLGINWVSYQYWLPLMIAILFFISALLYMLKRRTNWEQLLRYTESLNDSANEAYIPPPFMDDKATTEFLRLGHALGRVHYQLTNDYRRIKTLKHRLERLIDESPLPMLMIMRHGQISFFNTRFEQTFITASQSDTDDQLTDFVAGKDEATQTLLQKLSNFRVTRTLIVYGLENKQTYQLHVTPWFGVHGQVHGFTVLLNNINELAVQTEQLQLNNQQLQQKLDDFNELRAVMGYKLRLPLETLIDILEPIDPETLTEDQNDILESLIETSHSMLTTLNEVLDIGDIEVRQTRLSIEPVDIYKLSQEVNELIIDKVRQQGLELVYFFDPECPRCIDTDKTRLRQILLNLLHNAVKFTTSGHVALIVDAIRPEQLIQIAKGSLLPVNEDIKADQAHYWIRFSIQDSGMGIDIAKQHQLLTYFNKNNQTKNKNNNNVQQNTVEAGLGLNNVNSFARLLGGFIEMKSTLDKGSVFNLYLPCRQPNYQPVYHPNQYLTHIHLIAVVNETLVAAHLRHLCKHLSIPATIYTCVDLVTIQQLTEQLAQDIHTLAPVLLLDYEYYDTSTIIARENWSSDKSDEQRKPVPAISVQTLASDSASENNQIVKSIDRRQALNSLLSNNSLPKILFSMKPERRTPSSLLDQCDGFLVKPLDSSLLLSELMRLTLPVRQALTHLPSQPQLQSSPSKEDASKVVAELDKDEHFSPLILVVEDSPTNQKIACKILSRLGYRSIVAEDGQQALETLNTQRQDISLILMDCRMPVMDGLQATQAIRAQGDDIPIVALTANSSDEDRAACMQVGMDSFLSKPIDKKELAAVLQSLIES
ncbi:response regulator [Psychrobacter sp. APC 3426]|uniref:response regulator n=1 Tax=Psychrobacter sp. APC 3426 TaxID=3035177 RepID=UPI0025B3C88C|nr:hybrid sensor histidine kinase/response regulator [Psychrobacter sp. APC 3426]MDN3397797.1 response regulator [Psychrobacter sp. APC 3426]